MGQQTIQDLINTEDGDAATLTQDASVIATAQAALTAAQTQQQTDTAQEATDETTLTNAIANLTTPVISVISGAATGRVFFAPGMTIVSGMAYPLADTVDVPAAPSSPSS